MSFVIESVYPKASSDEDNAQHQAVGAWFLGPQAENFDWFKSCINSVIDEQRRARTSYYPTDGVLSPTLFHLTSLDETILITLAISRNSLLLP
jgi:hypothetical protein